MSSSWRFDLPEDAGTFWNCEHELSALASELHDALVPAFGPAATPEGELLRQAQNAYRDYYNNGNATLGAMIDNARVDAGYAPPEWAPETVRDFFDRDLDDVLCQSDMEDLMRDVVRAIADRRRDGG